MCMKKLYVSLLFTLFVILGFSQTNPSAAVLPVVINFGTTNFTPPFSGMVAWTGSGTRPYGTQANAEASLPGTDMLAAVLFNTAPASAGGGGQYGHALSSDARVTILQSGNTTNGTSQIGLAINTTNQSNISISYSLALSVANARDIGLALQYRIGTAGSFSTISGSAVTYNSGSTNGGDADGPTDNDTYSFTLPIAAEGNAVVQLRWITWRGTQAGSSSGIGLDNISITGTTGGGSDITPPTVSTLTPLDNTTNVNTSTNLQVVFSEPIVKGTGNILVKKVADNSNVQTIDVTTTAVSVTGSTATVTINTLANSTDYYIEVSSGAFTDVALNVFAGISGATTWNFTTIQPVAAGIIGNNYTFIDCANTFINEGWRQYSVTGPSQVWGCITAGRTSDGGAVQMSGFSGSAIANQDWLISPRFDFTSISFPTLQFYSRGEFTGDNLILKVSTNYVDGTDPNTATWIDLNGNFPTNANWTLSNNIDLSSYQTTNVRLAWYYTSTTTNAKRWTIDDVTVFNNIPLSPCPEPSAQPTNLALFATAASISGTFTLIPNPTNVVNYLVVRSIAAAVSPLPIDGTTYTIGQTIGSGNGTVIDISDDGTFIDNTVAASTQYYYFIFAMEDQACSNGPNYNQANPLSSNITTPALAACTTPSSPVAPLTLTAGNTSVSGTFTSSNASKYLVIKSTVAPPLGASPSNGTVYTIGQAFGNGDVVSYTNTTSFTATGLTVSTAYYFYVFATNDACTGAPSYNTTSLDGTTTTTNNPTGIPPGYYNATTGLTCAALKTAVNGIITNGHTQNNYGSLDDVNFLTTDDRLNDAGSATIVWDMYSDNPAGAEPYTFTFSQFNVGSSSDGEGNGWNKEHSFPNSWFSPTSSTSNFPGADLHHLFPTDMDVNGLRSNYPYGIVANATTTTANGSKLGSSAINFPGYSGPVFEPINAYKGDLARATLYMVTRYQSEQPTWQNYQAGGNVVMDGTTWPSVEISYLQMLINWHNADPVSTKEIDRNNDVYGYQANRNPFVDHPEYVGQIWSSSCGLTLPITLLSFDGKLQTNEVLLKWIAENPDRFNRFEIERSTNGIKYEKIGTLPVQINSTYDFSDKNLPNSKVAYYRLKMVDNNGVFSYSTIVTIKLPVRFSNALVYPNPTVGELNIKLYEPLFTNSTLQILDVTGRMVKQHSVSANNVNIQMDVKGLAAGRYFIKIANSQQVINQSFVVIK